MHSVIVYKENKVVRINKLGSKKAISIGRHHLNDIYLPDSSHKVSRFHAALFCDADNSYFIQDLGSRNNTFINGNKRDYGRIHEGDKIGIGDFTLVFQRQLDKSKLKEFEIALFEDAPEDEIETIFSPFSFNSEDLELLRDDPHSLLLLYKVSRFANSSLDIESSLQLIIDELAKYYPADRIFVALLQPEATNLSIMARFPLDKFELKFSHTLIRHMLDEKQALFTNDALADERFKGSGKAPRSVLEQQIRSAILIPLKWDGEIRGLLYMDSSKERGLFHERDLRLLNLLGNDLSTHIERSLNYRNIEHEKMRLENRLDLENTIIGISPKTKEILDNIEKIANTDATVLITGETGTGKDLVARAIHKNSKRRARAFIEVNCAAIPDNLLESELFGVIANYPGFHNKEPLKGRFELAHQGTIFLNEVGELPLRLQSKLLDVLDKKCFWPLGKTQPVFVDIRIIAATNRDLQREIREGRFREDLYERLNIVPLHLPPLRDRKEDIPLLAGYFLHIFRQDYGKTISRFSNACVELFLGHEWPRNIREMKNSIERAIILNNRSVITPDLFDIKTEKKSKPKTLKEVEKEHIIKVLEFTDGNKEKALKILGISKQTLYNKGRQFKLSGFETQQTSKT